MLSERRSCRKIAIMIRGESPPGHPTTGLGLYDKGTGEAKVWDGRAKYYSRW